MSEGSESRADDAPERPRRPWGRWRIGTPAVVLLCGALFVVSATNSEGTDLRPGRYTDLAALTDSEADKYDALEQRVSDLNAEVEQLAESVDDRQVDRFSRRVERLEDPAGMTPKSGPGVAVTLSDAPEEVINSTTQDLNLLVVHQQDIQAVVNAMWKGGATAVTVQGQRVITTTGIKCEGNSVQLHGVPYPQPYVIEAVGDQTELVRAIADDDYLQIYREQAAIPDISVGWDLQLQALVTAPAYDGLTDLSYAKPLR
ncbi:MAG TPA: DUF881 domain-containing protein [Nocardioides sp.]|nr:DUF881 domain-containing protein [Nocardioides sp.]